MPLSHAVQICSKVSCFQNKSSSYRDLKCVHPHPSPLGLYGHCIKFNLGKIWIESCRTPPWGRCASQMKCCRQKGSTCKLGSCESSQTFICISPLLLSGDWKQLCVSPKTICSSLSIRHTYCILGGLFFKTPSWAFFRLSYFLLLKNSK